MRLHPPGVLPPAPVCGRSRAPGSPRGAGPAGPERSAARSSPERHDERLGRSLAVVIIQRGHVTNRGGKAAGIVRRYCQLARAFPAGRQHH